MKIDEELLAYAATMGLAMTSGGAAALEAAAGGTSLAALKDLAARMQAAGNADGAALIRATIADREALKTISKIGGNVLIIGSVIIDGYGLYSSITNSDVGGAISSGSGLVLTGLTVAGGAATEGTALALAGPAGIAAAGIGAAILLGYDMAVGRPARKADAASRRRGCAMQLGNWAKFTGRHPECADATKCGCN